MDTRLVVRDGRRHVAVRDADGISRALARIADRGLTRAALGIQAADTWGEIKLIEADVVLEMEFGIYRKK